MWAFAKTEKPIRVLSFSVWVFSMSRYRAGDLYCFNRGGGHDFFTLLAERVERVEYARGA